MSNDQGVRLSGIRRIIADRMCVSLREAAQLSYHTTICASELVSSRENWKKQGIPVGFEDIVLRALCDTLLRFPRFNSRVIEDKIYSAAQVDACVAIDLPTGLVAPAMWDISAKSIPEITAARREILDRARTGKLTVPEMTSGTITLSNLGGTRVEHFTPILNQGQVALLGLGRIVLRPWIGEHGTIEALPVMGLSLTVDHRIIDGAESGAFLSHIAELLENGARPPASGDPEVYLQNAEADRSQPADR